MTTSSVKRVLRSKWTFFFVGFSMICLEFPEFQYNIYTFRLKDLANSEQKNHDTNRSPLSSVPFRKNPALFNARNQRHRLTKRLTGGEPGSDPTNFFKDVVKEVEHARKNGGLKPGKGDAKNTGNGDAQNNGDLKPEKGSGQNDGGLKLEGGDAGDSGGLNPTGDDAGDNGGSKPEKTKKKKKKKKKKKNKLAMRFHI